MKEREALKLALEALEDYEPNEANKAIIAIKEALAQSELCKYGQEPKSCTSSPMDCQCAIDATFAQPEQEPVACPSGPSTPVDRYFYEQGYKAALRHTTPPQRTWVGLTDDEMTECIVSICNTDDGTGDTRDLIRAVEAKLKEKNT